MAQEQQDATHRHATSTGQALSQPEWLDTHFEACRPEYEAMLRSVGIQSGWRLLDAGCGSGSQLPLLAELVGPTGDVAAIDLAPENVAAVRGRVADWGLACPVAVEVGSLTALPYPEGHFDAVWCANVAQFFTDEELLTVLAELRRVVRPDGLVGIKDVDMALVRLYPADPFLVSHLAEVSIRGSQVATESRGSLRGRELRRWLERAGLVDVWQRATLIERWAPLRPVERQLWGDWLAFLAELAEERGVPASDLEVWQTLRDPSSPGHLLNHPDFYACEGQVVAVGRVPRPVA